MSQVCLHLGWAAACDGSNRLASTLVVPQIQSILLPYFTPTNTIPKFGSAILVHVSPCRHTPFPKVRR